jgi:hypothetical protein
MWTITVYGYIPRSPNSRVRKHWGRTLDERSFWEAVLGSAAYVQDIPKADGDSRRIEYEIHKPGQVRLRDHDNLVASVKHAQDAMVNVGLLHDDSPAHLDFGGVSEYNGHKGYKTIIRIWEQ